MENKNNESFFEKIVSLCKRRGFVYPSSEIYGGFANVYDFGPTGALLAKNIRDLWIKRMVQERDDMYFIDGSILMHPKSWEASGHTAAFTDALVDCSSCKKRFRAEKLAGWELKKDNRTGKWTVLKQGTVVCPECGGKIIPKVKEFNLLMETSVGAVKDKTSLAYLKGESCQNAYLDYLPVRDTMGATIPFGLAQIGKAFRNEITLGQFIFRLREFEQMDVEFYCSPETSADWYKKWKEIRFDWYVNDVGLSTDRLRWRQHTPQERIFYARDAWDIDYRFFDKFDELEGLHDRSDYDLKQQGKFSRQVLDYFDPKTGRRFIPNIIECSGGVQRTFLAAICEAYSEEEVNGEKRVVLRFKPTLAPYKIAVFPLLSNKTELVKKARKIYKGLRPHFFVAWDDIGNIGKRYRRQDEIGTPWCVTVDFQTLKDDTVTIRDRDSMKQERVAVKELPDWFKNKLVHEKK